MDTGMFEKEQSDQRKTNAIQQVERMGYEFNIVSAVRRPLSSGGVAVTIRIRNTGAAPFYYPWKVELASMHRGRDAKPIAVDWSVLGLLPDDSPRTWSVELTAEQAAEATDGFALRIANPLPKGMPLRFANEYSEDSPEGWWLLP